MFFLEQVTRLLPVEHHPAVGAAGAATDPLILHAKDAVLEVGDYPVKEHKTDDTTFRFVRTFVPVLLLLFEVIAVVLC